VEWTIDEAADNTLQTVKHDIKEAENSLNSQLPTTEEALLLLWVSASQTFFLFLI